MPTERADLALRARGQGSGAEFFRRCAFVADAVTQRMSGTSVSRWQAQRPFANARGTPLA